MSTPRGTVVLKTATCLISSDRELQGRLAANLVEAGISCRGFPVQAARDAIDRGNFDVVLFDLDAVREDPSSAEDLLSTDSWVTGSGKFQAPIVALVEGEVGRSVLPKGLPVIDVLDRSVSEEELLESVKRAASLRSVYSGVELAEINARNLVSYVHSTNAVLRLASSEDVAHVASFFLGSALKHLEFVIGNLKPIVRQSSSESLSTCFDALEDAFQQTRKAAEAVDQEGQS